MGRHVNKEAAPIKNSNTRKYKFISPLSFQWCHLNKISFVGSHTFIKLHGMFKAPPQGGEVDDSEKNVFFRIAVGFYKNVPLLSVDFLD